MESQERQFGPIELHFEFAVNPEGLSHKEQCVAFHRIDAELYTVVPLTVIKKEGYADKYQNWNQCGLLLDTEVAGQCPVMYTDIEEALTEFNSIKTYLECYYGELERANVYAYECGDGDGDDWDCWSYELSEDQRYFNVTCEAEGAETLKVPIEKMKLYTNYDL